MLTRPAGGGAPDEVVGLAGRGHQVLGEGYEGLLGAIPPVRLMVPHAVHVQLVAALAEHTYAGEACDDVVPTKLHLRRAIHLHRSSF